MNNARTPQRNALCPCGSGRRYKHCHGSDAGTPVETPPLEYAGWDRFSASERAQLWDKMLKALAAHKAFQLDAAGALYEEVIARAPLTFDAVHMLGVIQLMKGDLDRAESLLTRARELAPDVLSIRQNLQLLAHRRQEHEGLYSLRTIVANDMLRLFGATGALAQPGQSDPFAPPAFASGAPLPPFHIVVPGEFANAASNQTGVMLWRRIGNTATLWSGAKDLAGTIDDPSLRVIDLERATQPSGGTLVLFGLNARVLLWLPAVAETFDAIVIALDAHDPAACVELLGRLPPAAIARIRFVARSAVVLDDLGLAGTVDPMLFYANVRARGPARRGARLRLGVFIPALGGAEDEARWQMLEWLRERGPFLRLLYAGRLPSRHLPNADEHLLALATDWTGWHDDLDALFYWGAEGHMRQYDRLVFEAAAAAMPVVADGFGDFGAVLAGRADCAQFFDAASARSAVIAMLARLTEVAPVGLVA